MGCHAAGRIEKDLIDIAPSLRFRRVIFLDDRVSRGVEVLRGMTVRRTVAAADIAAGAAPQMHPLSTSPTMNSTRFRAHDILRSLRAGGENRW